MPGSDFADLSAFFDADEFGSSATWTPAGGSPVAGVVLLDSAVDLQFDTMQQATPTVRYRVSAWPTVDGGDQIAIGSATYKVVSAVHIDDGGIGLARLVRVS